METKSGWRTTEFWTKNMVQVVSVLAMVASFRYNITPEVQSTIVQFGLAIIGLVEMAYVISRGIVKKG